MSFDAAGLRPALQRFLDEDLGSGDVTSEALVPAQHQARGKFIAKADGILCGLDVAEQVFLLVDSAIQFERLLEEGTPVESRQEVARVTGNARAILAAERTALNLLQRMSGIATLTHQYLRAVDGTDCKILETRKTVPGLRLLDKRAVVIGGGTAHRKGLYDQILIKENHIAWMGESDGQGSRPIEQAVGRARDAGLTTPLEIEVFDADEAVRAALAGADIVLLDNFSVAEVRDTVERLANYSVQLEASGGITLENVRDFAKTGVHRISVGALTHSVRALDLSLLFEL